MTRIRREIRSSGITWDAPILWYAKAVRELQKRPIDDKTSWLFLAAIHGITVSSWTGFGYLAPGAPLPENPQSPTYWNQCQHQTWYFWPWHRAYLWTFEEIVLEAVKSLNGPTDWALPYWNYSSTAAKANTIPQEFTHVAMPDGSPNPLHVAARYGWGVPTGDADLSKSIIYSDFVGNTNVTTLGVGGPDTTFSHYGKASGLVEEYPHNLVHDDVGGSNGVMSDPQTAALDPIFWIHHCNIDRLWEVWLRRDPAHNHNPADPNWLGGPRDRLFRLYDAHTVDRQSNPQDVLSTIALGYDYDDTSDPLPGQFRRTRRLRSIAPSGAPGATVQTAQMTSRPNIERLDVNGYPVAVGRAPVDISLSLAPGPAHAVAKSFTTEAINPETPAEPDRVFLKLEGVRTERGSGIFDVLVRPSAIAPYVDVGAVSLFGVAAASDPNSPHAGAGATKIVEITDAFDKMTPAERESGHLEVRIAPRDGNWSAEHITIGQISLIRQSGE